MAKTGIVIMDGQRTVVLNDRVVTPAQLEQGIAGSQGRLAQLAAAREGLDPAKLLEAARANFDRQIKQVEDYTAQLSALLAEYRQE